MTPIQQAEHSPQFLQHINPMDQHIHLTAENTKEDGFIPLLDTLVSQGPINTLDTLVYRKPTHMDQYLHWDSNHHLPAQYSVCNTLANRARVVCTSQPAFIQEEDHIKQALIRCSYPHGPQIDSVPRLTIGLILIMNKGKTTQQQQQQQL